MKNGKIKALSKSKSHTFNKYNEERLILLEGLGVEGDAHMGKLVKHRYDVGKDATKPNLRQVHLIHTELHDELAEKGFEVSAGEMGENITTSDIDLLSLPEGTILKIGKEAEIQITGLRYPCKLLESIKKGLMKAVLDKDEEGNLILKSGVMSIVTKGGEVRVGDEIQIQLPPKPHKALKPV